MPRRGDGRHGDVVLLYASEMSASGHADPRAERLMPLLNALGRAGIDAEAVRWHADVAGDLASMLRGVAVVLVWCNPIEDGVRRDALDALLETLGDGGVLVSAHPDAIRRIGTKDVLWATRDLPFGSDVARIESVDELDLTYERLHQGPRVLKQLRGQSGAGVWRLELDTDGGVLVRQAARGSRQERLDLGTLRERLRPYFGPDAGGHLIDQQWQPRIAEGMTRAYLVGQEVVGFGHQAVNAFHPDIAQPGARRYHGPDAGPFRTLRTHLESGWIQLLCEQVGLVRDRVPLLWDCDFMYGGQPGDGTGRFVLCEVNVSSVAPFPPSAIAPLVAAVRARLGGLDATGPASSPS